ncbi:putative membrane protein [Candidatus Ichthyocystis hellenicum]|uniref:Putative membrane protein n=2 Tax=Burkholderiales genera incertae sedis TaxID=224471 RepID=A0A0S4M7H7_9BURK|nr:putative membrane protein [Candidatus Ichthyocystis hellenicum]
MSMIIVRYILVWHNCARGIFGFVSKNLIYIFFYSIILECVQLLWLHSVFRLMFISKAYKCYFVSYLFIASFYHISCIKCSVFIRFIFVFIYNFISICIIFCRVSSVIFEVVDMSNSFSLWMAIIFISYAPMVFSAAVCDTVNARFYDSHKWWKVVDINVIPSNTPDSWRFITKNIDKGIFSINLEGNYYNNLTVNVINATGLGVQGISGNDNWIVVGRGYDYVIIKQYFIDDFSGAAFRVHFRDKNTYEDCTRKIYNLFYKGASNYPIVGECEEVYIKTADKGMVIYRDVFSKYLKVRKDNYPQNDTYYIILSGYSDKQGAHIQFWHNYNSFISPEFSDGYLLKYQDFGSPVAGYFYVANNQSTNDYYSNSSNGVVLLYAYPGFNDRLLWADNANLELSENLKSYPTRWRIMSSKTGKDCTKEIMDASANSTLSGNFYSFATGKKIAISYQHTDDKKIEPKFDFVDQSYFPDGSMDQRANFILLPSILKLGSSGIWHLMTINNRCLVVDDNQKLIDQDCSHGKTDIWSYEVLGMSSDIYSMRICTSRNNLNTKICLKSDPRGNISVAPYSTTSMYDDYFTILFSRYSLGVPYTITVSGRCIGPEDKYGLVDTHLESFFCSSDSYRFNKVTYIYRPSLFYKTFNMVYHNQSFGVVSGFDKYCSTTTDRSRTVSFSSCSYGNKNQLWFLDDLFQFHNVDANKCLFDNHYNDSKGNESNVFLSDCDGGRKLVGYHYYNVRNNDRYSDIFFNLINKGINGDNLCLQVGGPYVYQNDSVFSVNCSPDSSSQLFSVDIGGADFDDFVTLVSYDNRVLVFKNLGEGTLKPSASLHDASRIKFNDGSAISIDNMGCFSGSGVNFDYVKVSPCDGSSSQIWKLFPVVVYASD